MSVFLQMSLVGVGDILWALRSTLRTHTPWEGGWLRCRSSSLVVNEWFRRGVAGSQSFGHRRYIHWKYGHSMWGTRWALAQDVCWWGLVGWEPLSLRQVDSDLLSFLSNGLLFGALNSIPHLSAHVAAASRSALRVAQLDAVDLPWGVCKLVSSAKMEHWLRVDWGRSFMKMRNNTGPRTVPCMGYSWLWNLPFGWRTIQLNPLFPSLEKVCEPFKGTVVKTNQRESLLKLRGHW